MRCLTLLSTSRPHHSVLTRLKIKRFVTMFDSSLKITYRDLIVSTFAFPLYILNQTLELFGSQNPLYPQHVVVSTPNLSLCFFLSNVVVLFIVVRTEDDVLV